MIFLWGAEDQEDGPALWDLARAYALDMTELGPDDTEGLKLARDLLLIYLVYRVEMGLVEIGNRATEEIRVDLIWNAREAVGKADFEFPLVWDHRDLLLDQASSAASEGALENAVVLYATWIEHYVNRLLLVTLERQQGLSPQSSRALIRELRLPTKVTALWSVNAANSTKLSPGLAHSFRCFTR